MNFLHIFLLLFISYHCILSTPVSSTDNQPNVKNDSSINVNGVTIGSQYFHATQQYFYYYAAPGSSCNNKSVTIPDGYIANPGIGAHKLHTETKTWNDARKICFNEGAQLAVINSAEEEVVIQKYKAELHKEELWIGIHEQFKNDDWVTVKGDPLEKTNYVHWHAGEPNHVAQSEHCATITNDGMNDLNCEKEMSFICKIYL